MGTIDTAQSQRSKHYQWTTYICPTTLLADSVLPRLSCDIGFICGMFIRHKYFVTLIFMISWYTVTCRVQDW